MTGRKEIHNTEEKNPLILSKPLTGASGAIQSLYMKVLMQRNFVAELYRENASFTRKTAS